MDNGIITKLKTLISVTRALECTISNPYGVAEPTIRKLRIYIRNVFGEKSDYLSELESIGFVPVSLGIGSPSDGAYIRIFNAGKKSLADLIEVIIEDFEMNQVANVPVNPEKTELNLGEVFIVHGHDDAATSEVARFIQKLGFKEIILREQASSGNTIIEQIEKKSNVGFGIVLYTPCDVGAVKGEESHLQPRARQNVIFEHGFLIGKLGRNKVCALVKHIVEKPTDISGVVFVQMDDHMGWKLKIADELKEAGYPIDKNKM